MHGTSTRKVGDTVAAMGADTGISESEVSRICADLDTDVAAVTGRDRAVRVFADVFRDATYSGPHRRHTAREGLRVALQAVVIPPGQTLRIRGRHLLGRVRARTRDRAHVPSHTCTDSTRS